MSQHDSCGTEPLSMCNSGIMASSNLENQEYTVGWISTLPKEMAAARAMLDEIHGRPQQQHWSDQSTYVLGRIGRHNVVTTCLPNGTYGSVSAATAAAQLLSSFRSVKFGLLVGVGGGVPSDGHDIRLGDVVISQGVVQYDLGKMKGGLFTRTGSLNKPPSILLNALSCIQMENMVEGNKIVQFISDMLTKNPWMRSEFSHQGVLHDQLYQADYEHVAHGRTCESCDASKALDRPRRDSDAPRAHYGIIGSGNQVMKHAITRNQLGEELDISYSHKNDRWQGYPAATAAAYAKELLGLVPGNNIEATALSAEIEATTLPPEIEAIALSPELEETISVVPRDLVIIDEQSNKKDEFSNSDQSDDNYQDFLNWLSRTNHAAQCSNFLARRQEGTGLWVMNSPEFKYWLSSSQKTLYCPGNPGTGKTMIASIVFQHLRETFPRDSFADHRTGIAIIYCDYKGTQEQQEYDLLSALLEQVVQRENWSLMKLPHIYNHHQYPRSRPSLDDLDISLQRVFRCYSQVFIVIDAFVGEGTLMKLLSRICNFQAHSNVKFMATSRFIPKIENQFKGSIFLEVRASNEDIGLYLDSQMPRIRNFFGKPCHEQQVKSAIIEAANGMFLLPRLQIDALTCQPTQKAIDFALKKVASDSVLLTEAYHEAIKRIDSQGPKSVDLAKRVLSWITYSRRHLTISELQHALAIERGASRLDKMKIPDIDEIFSVCAGLVIIEQESRIVRLVHYTTQEYFEHIGPTWMPNGPTEIALACLTYLSFETFSSDCSPSDKEFETRVQQNVFVSYAACHWGDHARNVQAEILDVALPFLSNISLTSAFNQATAKREYRNSRYSQRREKSGLHLATHSGLQQLLAILLENPESPVCKEMQRNDDQSPLWIAAEGGYEGLVRLLLEKGAKVWCTDIYRQTVLSRAAGAGHEGVVKLLLEKVGHEMLADYKDAADEASQSPLSWAARGGHEGVVRLLLEKDADIWSRDVCDDTPLSWAVTEGHEAVSRLLLEKSAEIESMTGGRETMLSKAVRGENEALVKLFLERNVRLESRDGYGRTPLSWAAEQGHMTILNLLLEKAADIESKNRDGETPLKWAIRSGLATTVRLLLEKSADIESKGGWGGTPLIDAILGDHVPIVKLLLEKGAGIETKGDHGRTALNWAATVGCEATARLLLDRGADTGSTDVSGRTPMSHAASRGHIAIIKTLLENRADISSVDNTGRTPLARAAEAGREAAVKFLLEKGSDASCVNNSGLTPLSLARNGRHKAVVKLLESKTSDS